MCRKLSPKNSPLDLRGEFQKRASIATFRAGNLLTLKIRAGKSDMHDWSLEPEYTATSP